MSAQTETAGSETSVLLSQERVSAAEAAAYEVQLLAEMLENFVVNEDGEGRLTIVARSLLFRVRSLADAIAEALDVDYPDMHKVQATVYCKRVDPTVGHAT